MHATNNGPFRSHRELDFFDDFKEAGIPFIRNHDASFDSWYGGEHSIDVENIFPDMDADENDPANYDFALTDLATQWSLDAGSRIVYRLGTKIEHEIRKYHTKVPKDFQKYARVCEHIIRHMCYGWADGNHMDIPYWEIWNEADSCLNGVPNSTWQGTHQEFLQFFEIMAKHLKSCFPELKIGGPAYCYCVNSKAANEFIQYASEHQVPIDFFSWHGYETDPQKYPDAARYARNLLDRFGYQKTELHLNEWNYIIGWKGEEIRKSYKTIRTAKGAAFCAASMLSAQKSPMDMFMYYNLGPSAYNGLFAYDTYERCRPYYTFWQFNKLYRAGNEVYSESDDSIFTGAARDDQGKGFAQIAYYEDASEEDELLELDIRGLHTETEIKMVLVS